MDRSAVKQSTVMHVRCPAGLPESVYRQVLALLEEISPVVQAVPPGAAYVELRSVLRCHGVGALRLGEIARARVAARWGVALRIGIAPTISTATTASAQIAETGGVLLIEPDTEREWLAQLPVEALTGVGPKQAAVLRDYGVHSIGLLAAIPEATLQRLLGGRAGRTVSERARGIDPRTVTARSLPASASLRHIFDGQALDGFPVRAALLDLVVRLGVLLRDRDQVAQGVTLTLEFAGGGTWGRTKKLAQPSAHEEDLRAMAYRLMDGAALQRARLTALALRAEDLLDADQVAEQVSLDATREARLIAEAAVDRARQRFGPRVMLGPAALLGKAS